MNQQHQRQRIMIEDARLEVSKLLGSIGLPPLTTMTSMNASSSHSHHQLLVMHPPHAIEFANAHIDLLHSMHSVLDTLRSGTSLRLGLGVSGDGGDCRRHVVSRVEKAWIMRHRRLHQLLLEEVGLSITPTKINDSNDNNNYDDVSTTNHRNDNGICDGRVKSAPKDDSATVSTKTKRMVLTFQKLRNILHRAVVDQAMSFHDTLKDFHDNFTPTTTTMTALFEEWGIFVNDLRHTSHNAPPLTLSRLSNYIDKLGSYLSFSLSVLLVVDSDKFDNITNSWCSSSDSSIKRSIQFANERSAYLQSACPMSHLHYDEDETAAMRQENGATGSVDNILLLKNLQDTFQAARISLWAAVGQSQRTSPDEDEINDARDWWSQFKYYIECSCSLIPVIEAQYHHLIEKTAIVNEQRRKEGADEDNADLVNNSRCNNVVEVLEDAGKTTTLPNHRSDKLLNYLDKTIVFSGSGVGTSHNVTQQSIIREKAESSVSGRPARAFTMMDQTMLLQDLERRLKSMGLVMEHEVTMDTLTEFGNNKGDDTISENPAMMQRNPLFLGVSGSLLLELTSAINTNNTTSSLEDGYNDG